VNDRFAAGGDELPSIGNQLNPLVQPADLVRHGEEIHH
jgi:hypothetical protein